MLWFQANLAVAATFHSRHSAHKYASTTGTDWSWRYTTRIDIARGRGRVGETVEVREQQESCGYAMNLGIQILPADLEQILRKPTI